MKRTTHGAALVAILAFVGAARANSLVLWNKLDGPASEIGTDFGLHEPGSVHFDRPGVFGDSLRTEGGSTGSTGGYMTMAPDEFFGADKTRGAVELWINKGVDHCWAYETGMPNVFGHVPYGGGYSTIMAVWSDDWSKVGRPDQTGGMRFAVHDAAGVSHSLLDPSFQDVAVGTWVHYGFVWDLAGIDGSDDTLRMYRDGALIQFTDEPIVGLWADASELRVYGHHQYGRLNQSMLHLDNLKVWDAPKTDFSDRFVEGVVPEPVTVASLLAGVAAAGAYVRRRRAA